MKTITVKLPDFLDATLAASAAARRSSKSAVVRDALMLALPEAPKLPRSARKPTVHDRLAKYQGAGATGISDLASNPRYLEGYGR